MPPLNVRQLEAFRATMISGSVTGAGTMLRVTQPSVSKLLSQLEAQTGLRLFDRVRGRLIPRAEAKALLLEVDRAFSALEETARNARRLAQGIGGHLRVVSTGALGLDLLPDIIGRLLTARADVTIEFNIRSSSYVEEWVEARRCDVGFSTSRPHSSGVRSELIVSAPAVCILPAGHRLATQRSVSPQDLAQERFISLSHEAGLRRRVDDAFEAQRVLRRNVVESGYASCACALVAAGVGVSVLDPFSAYAALQKGGVSLASFDPMIPFFAYALFPLDAPEPSLLPVLLEEFRQRSEKVIRELQLSQVNW